MGSAGRFLDNAVDPTTGTIILKATLPNSDEKLTSGQFLSVTLVLDMLSKTVTIPNEAVQQGSDGNFVFVVKTDNTVDVRKIETVTSNDGLTAIKKGLEVGEVVVTDGQLRLAPGVKVKTKDADNANAPAAPTVAK